MVKYYKSVPKNLKSHSLQYQLDTLIVDPTPFDAEINCDNGIHFTTIDHILYWAYELKHSHIVEVTLPENALKSEYCDGTKWKCDRIILSNMKSIRDFIKDHMDKVKLKPFHYACLTDNKEMIEILLDIGATSSVNEKDNDGYTLLHYFCMDAGEKEMVALLLANGAAASINEKCKDGNTPLHIACRYANDKEMVTLLLANGAAASVNEKDIYGYTALHIACRDIRNKEIVEILLANGAAASINQKDDYGYTALHYACQCLNNKEIVEMLLANGAAASVNEKNIKNLTALHYAHFWDNKEIIALLLAYGAV